MQDAIAFRHAFAVFIIASPIERVRHRADKLAADIAWQLGIRVKGDDVLHAAEHGRITHNEGETAFSVVMFTFSKQRVQIRQLAPFTLMAHPHPFLRIPSSGSMEQVEHIPLEALLTSAIFLIQLIDPGMGQPYQVIIFRKDFLGRVA